MTRTVLVLNAGSSTLKYAVLTDEARTAAGTVDRVTDFDAAMRQVADELRAQGVDAADVGAVGHRVVHGGPDLTAPTEIDDDVVATIEELAALAPLHNSNAVACIRAVHDLGGDLPQVACFDTAWFSDLPAAAATYALDHDLATRERIRRYGFHGISHEYVAGEAASLLDQDLADLDLVVLHLGNGASASAVSGGRPVDTSMGMTPLEGLVMGTRSGDLDPGIVLHLLHHAGMDVDDLDDLLQHRSGLLGLSGHSDFRDLQAAVDAGDAHARLAYDVYCHRLRSYVGAYLAVLGGADAVVFTGGVGEHSPEVRADGTAGLAALGIEVDEERNRTGEGARVISPTGSPVAVLVVPTDEELAIARAVRSLLGGG